jgi:stage II sporulation protein D
MPHARWQKKIPKSDWLSYLSLKQKYPLEDSLSYNQSLAFSQTNGREVYFANKDLKIPLKNIRSDWQLKSTYFSIEQKNDTMVFNGRGYGHGVGLCQEGAMRMAVLRISFKDIINYYYTKVHLVDLAVLNFLKAD